MKNDPLVFGEAYLQAWDKKDLEAIAKYLHREIHFVGPMTEVTGKEKVPAICQADVSNLEGAEGALEIRFRRSGDVCLRLRLRESHRRVPHSRTHDLSGWPDQQNRAVLRRPAVREAHAVTKADVTIGSAID